MKKSNKSKRYQKALEEHNRFLMQMGVHPSQRKKHKPKPKVYKGLEHTIPEASPDSMYGVATKPIDKRYSGSRKLIGVAAMHKSNLIPIFDDESAKDVAQMRRN